MSRDLLGDIELESIKLKWDFYGPGLMGGRCAATGTCENRPVPKTVLLLKNMQNSSLSFDSRSAKNVRLQYGFLRA
jgi:hypothetical protein